MTTSLVLIICRDCKTRAIHGGRGLCNTCYRNHASAGTLHQFPSVRGDREWQATHRLTPAQRPAPPATTPPAPSGEVERWQDRAACRDADPEQFFPVSEAADSLAVQAAKQICRSCPVLENCADWVTANPQDHGIWAGTTPRERRDIRRTSAARSTA
ncbi:WhiB family transcriptional regulator [Nonomuraea turcica]|uniref:WhiB family transcriptional regulator n=1 Tax=Nonomuraea sp. G32 TaxID=3067274 RepID=UPI00273B1E99|nr:WhiB family transcriptional regulator [Nonomuraea sp. G32]MDP4501023.1 WhiB family transcriptional regulator [Nonomuraea sp. G32]